MNNSLGNDSASFQKTQVPNPHQSFIKVYHIPLPSRTPPAGVRNPVGEGIEERNGCQTLTC